MSKDETGATRLRPCFWWAALMTIAWALAIGVRAYVNMPHISLDMAATDPATVRAFEAAVRNHLVSHALIALVPLLILLPIAARTCRTKA